MAERTPMMEQYRNVKSRYQDAVLFFRLGDFYEMFFEDALEVSALLNLTLTRRQGEPMCGIPYHASRSYIGRLLKLGKKVAICEQLEQPGPGKGIVKRDVVEVVTPGTTLEDEYLETGSNNYLVSACRIGNSTCIAWLDASTGEFRTRARSDSDVMHSASFFSNEIARLAPKELLIQQSFATIKEVASLLGRCEGLVIGTYPDWSFDTSQAFKDLCLQFGTTSLKGFGYSGDEPELSAAGLLIQYLKDSLRSHSPHIDSIHPYKETEYVGLDEGSVRNLELVRSLQDGNKATSLLGIIDETKSTPGARLLRQWILQPLSNLEAILQRQDSVDWLYRDQNLLCTVRERLGRVLDMERLASRVATERAHARDLLAIRDSIRACLDISALLAASGTPVLLSEDPGCSSGAVAGSVADLIDRAIADDPPILLTEGRLIKAGFDAKVDELRLLKDDSEKILDQYLEDEKMASGIQNLRIRYNRIIGYYLEVTKGRLESVPSHFFRRQSLTTGERYSTTRLATLETEILGATDRLISLERELFIQLRAEVKKYLAALLDLGRKAAVRDCLASFAWAATTRGYSKPVLEVSSILQIRDGRHPVVEAWLPDGSFVPNDLLLGGESPIFALITGPNMAGKSTYLRQTALIVLLAQCGSFVPAKAARIGIVDRIFCRVGAQDNLARGESTFLVEMQETAHILNTATCKSLVIMDEVGRGTGTIDGLSIAWAASERLLDGIKCRTLFATHYHELTELKHEALHNLSLSVQEDEGEIIFLKKIIPGPATGSFGIHVARIAGMPIHVVARALEIQARLRESEQKLPSNTACTSNFTYSDTSIREKPQLLSDKCKSGVFQPDTLPAVEFRSSHTEEQPDLVHYRRPTGKHQPPSLRDGLFSPADLLMARLSTIKIDTITPLAALNLLAELCNEIQSK